MRASNLSCFANFRTELTALSNSELNDIASASSSYNHSSSFNSGLDIPEDEKRVRAGLPHARFSGATLMRAQSMVQESSLLQPEAVEADISPSAYEESHKTLLWRRSSQDISRSKMEGRVRGGMTKPVPKHQASLKDFVACRTSLDYSSGSRRSRVVSSVSTGTLLMNKTASNSAAGFDNYDNYSKDRSSVSLSVVPLAIAKYKQRGNLAGNLNISSAAAAATAASVAAGMVPHPSAAGSTADLHPAAATGIFTNNNMLLQSSHPFPLSRSTTSLQHLAEALTDPRICIAYKTLQSSAAACQSELKAFSSSLEAAATLSITYDEQRRSFHLLADKDPEQIMRNNSRCTANKIYSSADSADDGTTCCGDNAHVISLHHDIMATADWMSPDCLSSNISKQQGEQVLLGADDLQVSTTTTLDDRKGLYYNASSAAMRSNGGSGGDDRLEAMMISPYHNDDNLDNHHVQQADFTRLSSSLRTSGSCGGGCTIYSPGRSFPMGNKAGGSSLSLTRGYSYGLASSLLPGSTVSLLEYAEEAVLLCQLQDTCELVDTSVCPEVEEELLEDEDDELLNELSIELENSLSNKAEPADNLKKSTLSLQMTKNAKQ
ncbi:hypothetical protein CEUSTIGMA_g7729.t1 [Chlamydomonas eustigma]|uniref:Uncharacterized protein n=1 Tax=Chlamydomonas eustigma TaxID=1157962 RepID=A0A250XB32_9CHLO|nr:hypothetical protein CEUSTIGMA_g7729.t1 [Chlamydomonas eustigma]|eukprot:GAX80291.1 hypothetical protein CEUSTIGMA_g7729.t1 [Chlamydomonas eustigma]